MTISRLSAFAVMVALGAALTTAAGVRQQDAGVLLRAAIEKEDVAGDLEGAMAMYRQIIAEHGQDRPVAAKALLRLGGCHEKLGGAQARAAYERLIANYPEQTSEVAAARARLATMVKGSQASQPTFRRITIPGKVSPGAQLSPDGARLAMVSEGDVWVVNLRGSVSPEIAGVPERLSRDARASWAGLTWSRNAQWIAYNEDSVPTRSMHVLPVAGGSTRKVGRDVPLMAGADWHLALSADGSRLAYTTRSEGRMVLHLVAVDTGETVMRFADPDAIEPRISPDDGYVAYVNHKKWPSDPLGDVRVMRLADRSDVPVTTVPALFRSPAWSPDGRLLAFLAHPDKGNARVEELWIAPVPKTGNAAGEPTKIALPRFAQSIAGWTADDRIGLLSASPSRSPIYTVPVSGGKATQVSPEGSAFNPQWSPDGGSIYFRREQGDIARVPAAGGTVREVPMTGAKVRVALPNGGNHISPDGSRVVFAGPAEGVPGVHLWTMPVTGGEPVRLPMAPDLQAFQPRWSPDGRWIAFDSERSVPGERRLDENIFVISSQGGQPRQLTSHTDCFCELLAWSPAGDSIAYACSDGIIRIIPVGGGEPRTVLKVDGLDSPRGNSLAWTVDGSRLIYSAKGRLWAVSAAGGDPMPISTDLDGNILQFALSPDGRTIAFNAPSGGDLELWLMEDFLHLVKPVR